MALKNRQTLPLWPTEPIDPDAERVSYDVPADEFLVYFCGKPIPAVSSPLDAPGYEDVAVMFGIGPDNERTDEIVGIQVIPMMLGAVLEQPEWAVLTWAVMAGEFGTELLKERLPLFLDEIGEAFKRYWKPAPPIEEQLAQIAQAAEKRKSA